MILSLLISVEPVAWCGVCKEGKDDNVYDEMQY